VIDEQAQPALGAVKTRFGQIRLAPGGAGDR
jgi:hypothetical protein